MKEHLVVLEANKVESKRPNNALADFLVILCHIVDGKQQALFWGNLCAHGELIDWISDETIVIKMVKKKKQCW